MTSPHTAECPRCFKTFSLKNSSSVGEQVKCKSCGTPFTLELQSKFDDLAGSTSDTFPPEQTSSKLDKSFDTGLSAQAGTPFPWRLAVGIGMVIWLSIVLLISNGVFNSTEITTHSPSPSPPADKPAVDSAPTKSEMEKSVQHQVLSAAANPGVFMADSNDPDHKYRINESKTRPAETDGWIIAESENGGFEVMLPYTPVESEQRLKSKSGHPIHSVTVQTKMRDGRRFMAVKMVGGESTGRNITIEQLYEDMRPKNADKSANIRYEMVKLDQEVVVEVESGYPDSQEFVRMHAFPEGFIMLNVITKPNPSPSVREDVLKFWNSFKWTDSPPKTPDVAEVKKHMTPAQLALGDPVLNSIGMVLVPIPAGEFQMGSPDSDKDAGKDEKPQHLVKITKPYYLSAFEVTQEQYEQVMGSRPWQGRHYVQEGPDYPATYVSYDDATEFCRKLSEKEGVEYRLPTEAEWEYACRAGTTTVYSFGDDASKLGEYAWGIKNASDVGEKYAHRVGQKLPNPWGLHDMHGNVWERCQGRYAPYGGEKVVSDPTGPAEGVGRLLRGGSFLVQSSSVRSAYRAFNHPAIRNDDLGFRPVRTYNLSP